nr:hypothetical protein CFP56_61102 [Quercus suber]
MVEGTDLFDCLLGEEDYDPFSKGQLMTTFEATPVEELAIPCAGAALAARDPKVPMFPSYSVYAYGPNGIARKHILVCNPNWVAIQLLWETQMSSGSSRGDDEDGDDDGSATFEVTYFMRG